MYPYAQYYIMVMEDDCKKFISDLIGGKFSVVEAINKFMSIHFPDNRAYMPVESDPPKVVGRRLYKMYSVDTDIGNFNKLWVAQKHE